ncbi:DegV family EDD domain-containing protein [Aeromicrobium sp. SMF47]|uniref:DegV family EDD domain-containing protein n=1 Tax=Aeromicrobium yanjiei TaxID=2662028 RepID=A0A5Q2MLL5_9ACTN|nr:MULTISPECIES: DegV family protein [Aeromicrobium]MRJ78052.1 DegV family EDD domain-containing protein [Aeromicrobium yanjiei]MRK02412.1 DegV family EDD domain-containing protein [Aeromicrobium sp. S22]QGG40870.1 DegV family EDD domain-containing protein [Aeromicrobium yanjiei]
MIAIVTDSTSSLSGSDAERERITVVPLQVIIGAEVHTEGEDVTSEMIADALASFVPVSTSRPTPDEFLAVYERLASEGAEAIVSVHLSARMSGTLDSAVLAAKQASVPVTCVDSTQVGIATGFAAGRAAQARDAGEDVVGVADAARRAGETSTALLYVDTLEYLRRGGRVGAAAALIGSALAVKPILTISDGLVVPLERVRTQAKALARLEALAVESAHACADGFDIGVQHLAALSTATAVAERLASTLERESIPVDEVGAVIGAHVGPGMIAVTITPR